jgi:gliding motility-associated-like protein
VVVVSADSIPAIISIGSSFICSNDTVNVATVSILNGSITSWVSSGNGQLITTDMNNPIYIADSSDAASIVNLTFVLTSNNVCSPDSLVGIYPITVRPNPIAFLGGSTHICAIDIDAIVTGALVQNGDFQWSDNGFGNLSNTNSLSPVYSSVIEDTGSIVSIYLEVSSGTDCTYPLIDTAIFTVTVDSVGINPEITSFAGDDVTISLGQSIELNAQGVAITTWIWSPSAGLSENGISNPLASPTQTTEYILTVYDIFGCIDIDTIEITVIPDINFNIPSLFTPNGDDLNETWDIPELILLPNTAVTIINREGQEVFSSENYTNNWDGSFKGNPLPEATYYYWIRFANSDVTYKGPVTILRNIK